jgi:hypothetical protein
MKYFTFLFLLLAFLPPLPHKRKFQTIPNLPNACKIALMLGLPTAIHAKTIFVGSVAYSASSLSMASACLTQKEYSKLVVVAA